MPCFLFVLLSLKKNTCSLLLPWIQKYDNNDSEKKNVVITDSINWVVLHLLNAIFLFFLMLVLCDRHISTYARVLWHLSIKSHFLDGCLRNVDAQEVCFLAVVDVQLQEV